MEGFASSAVESGLPGFGLAFRDLVLGDRALRVSWVQGSGLGVGVARLGDARQRVSKAASMLALALFFELVGLLNTSFSRDAPSYRQLGS